MTEEEKKKVKKRNYNREYYQKKKSADNLKLVSNESEPESESESEIEELKASLIQVQTELEKLKTEKSESESESENLKEDVLIFQSEIKTLKAEKSESESESENLKSLMSQLKNYISVLKKSESESENLKEDVLIFQSEIKTLKAEKSESEIKTLSKNKKISQATFSAILIFIGSCIFWTINLSSEFHAKELIPFPKMISTLVELGLITCTIFAIRSRVFLGLSILIFLYLGWSMTYSVFEELDKGLAANAAIVEKSTLTASKLKSMNDNIQDENKELAEIQKRINEQKNEINVNKTKQDDFKVASYEYNKLRNDIRDDKERLDNFYIKESTQKEKISILKSKIKSLKDSQDSQKINIKKSDSNFMIIIHHSGLIALRLIVVFLSVALSHVLISRLSLKY